MLLIGGVLGLSACGSPPRVAVVERATIDSRLETERLGGKHIRIVQSGDTLYGIAFENRLDAKRLAAWNGISNSRNLKVGQRLRLTKPLGFVYRPRPETSSKRVVQTKNKPSVTAHSSGATQNKPSATISPKNGNNVKSKWGRDSWQWPVRGAVLSGFAITKGRQGIDIASKLGSSVRAARSGEVVYVGNGLKGYGNLVIIKHDESYLSAYAHNKSTSVSEGQRVKAKQVIALVGLNNNRVSALHFQIRLDGEPVNPVSYLPKR